MPATPFNIGLIQQAVSESADATLDAAERGIREAAERGAQIICLQELFNAPVLLQSRRSASASTWPSRFPGPTVDAMQTLAKELEVVLIVPIFERQAARRLSQLGRDHRRRRLAARRVSQDAHPRRSALQREVLLHAGRRDARRAHDASRAPASGFRVWKHALREHRRADLLGPVVSRGGAHHERCSAPTSCSIRRRSAGIPRRRRSSARRRSTRGARSQRAHAIANGVFVASAEPRRLRGRSRARTASSSSATRSSPIRSAASSPRRAPSRRS